MLYGTGARILPVPPQMSARVPPAQDGTRPRGMSDDAACQPNPAEPEPKRLHIDSRQSAGGVETSEPYEQWSKPKWPKYPARKRQNLTVEELKYRRSSGGRSFVGS